MHRFIRRKARLAAILLLAFLIFPIAAGADAPVLLSVTNASDPSLLDELIRIVNALPPGSTFTITIEVGGTLSASIPLVLFNKHGTIQNLGGATFTGFSAEIYSGGTLTLQDVHIDNSAQDLMTIRVLDQNPGNALLLLGSNTVTANRNFNTPVINLLAAALAIDKAPGGTDMGSTLTMKDALTAVGGAGTLTMKGGTVEAQGVANGTYVNLLVKGGKLTATGAAYAISAYGAQPGEGLLQFDSGTVYARGGTFDIVAIGSAEIVINGGSVDARKIYGQPVNGSGVPVYLVTVTVGDPPVGNAEVTTSVNGGAVFSCITDENGKLYLWMPAGAGAAEINVDGTIYHASGTVEENFDNAMLARSGPVVTAVAVTPSSATAERGGIVQFSAVVEGLYDPPQTVTWTVQNGHAGTSIDSTGKLTISKGETSRTLLVTATSTADPNYSDTAEVAVRMISLGAMLLILALFLVFLLIAILLLL